MPRTVLVVDDDPHIREVISFALDKAGFATETAGDGAEALAAIEARAPDLVVLDINMPEMDGLELCRRLRRSSELPILFLSSRDDEIDRIVGLELGADDYVTKPFSPRELVMRVKALLRRSAATDKAQTVSFAEPLVFDGLHLDPASYTVKRNDQPVTLTHKEFELLYFLASHPRMVFSRTQLLDQVWGYDFYGDDSNVTVHIHRLREKIEPDPSKPKYVHTVWGVGYKFEVL